MSTNITIVPNETNVTVTDSTSTVSITENVTSVSLTASTPISATAAASIAFTPTGYVTSNTVQGALEEVVNNYTISTTEPGSPTEGQLFYDTDDDLLKVYKVESGTGTWLTLLRAADGATSMSTLDGESF